MADHVLAPALALHITLWLVAFGEVAESRAELARTRLGIRSPFSFRCVFAGILRVEPHTRIESDRRDSDVENYFRCSSSQLSPSLWWSSSSSSASLLSSYRSVVGTDGDVPPCMMELTVRDLADHRRGRSASSRNPRRCWGKTRRERKRRKHQEKTRVCRVWCCSGDPRRSVCLSVLTAADRRQCEYTNVNITSTLGVSRYRENYVRARACVCVLRARACLCMGPNVRTGCTVR